jgi:hypothetical protein
MPPFSGRFKARGLGTEHAASERNRVEGDDMIPYVIVQARGWLLNVNSGKMHAGYMKRWLYHMRSPAACQGA